MTVEEFNWILALLGLAIGALGKALPQVIGFMERRARLRTAERLAMAGKSASQIRGTLSAADDEERPPAER